MASRMALTVAADGSCSLIRALPTNDSPVSVRFTWASATCTTPEILCGNGFEVEVDAAVGYLLDRVQCCLADQAGPMLDSGRADRFPVEGGVGPLQGDHYPGIVAINRLRNVNDRWSFSHVRENSRPYSDSGASDR